MKKKFDREKDKTMKVAELKNIEQGNRTIKKFVEELRRVAKKSRYKERPLVL